jgi:hypothetical protein
MITRSRINRRVRWRSTLAKGSELVSNSIGRRVTVVGAKGAPSYPTFRAFRTPPRSVSAARGNPEQRAAFSVRTALVRQVTGLEGSSRCVGEDDAIVRAGERAERSASPDGFALESKKPEAA